MSEHSALTDLIRRGRRRQIRHLLVQEASFSAALAFGGAILLLLIGTQILNWYWLVLLLYRVDEDNPTSVRHELLQEIVDYVTQKKVHVVTTSEGLAAMQLSP